MRKTKYVIYVLIAIVSTITIATSVNSINSKTNNTITHLIQEELTGPVLQIYTDKIVYETGEDVEIFFKNIGDEILSGGGPMVTIYNHQNEIVYQLAAYCYWELEPNEIEVWLPWDQTNRQGEQVEPGRYVIEGSLTGDQEIFVDTTIIYVVAQSINN